MDSHLLMSSIESYTFVSLGKEELCWKKMYGVAVVSATIHNGVGRHSSNLWYGFQEVQVGLGCVSLCGAVVTRSWITTNLIDPIQDGLRLKAFPSGFGPFPISIPTTIPASSSSASRGEPSALVDAAYDAGPRISSGQEASTLAPPGNFPLTWQASTLK